MADHDVRYITPEDGPEVVRELGVYALLEAAVKRIDEKDAIIRRLQAELDEARSTITYAYPKSLVIIDEIPAGFYEESVIDEAPDTRDPDDYEAIQDMWFGYCE